MIQLTQKQEQAIINMESFIDIKNHRLSFNSYEEYSEYFELLQKKCSKKRKILDNIKKSGLTQSQINEKIKSKKIEYYNTESNLKNYALKYIEKYFPTISKLKEKLLEKSKNEELTNIVIDNVKHLINEELMIKNKVYIETMFGNQNINKIKTKLYNKKFSKDLINKVIEELGQNEKSLISEESMRNKINKMISKGKSKSEIIFKLKERPEDEDLILGILEEYYSKDTLNDILLKEYTKLKNKYDNQKIIQKLISKGFKYSDIKNILNNE